MKKGTIGDPNAKNIKKTTWTQRIEGGLNPNPCGSCPLQANSVLHNPLTLKAILHNAIKIIQWLNTETK